MSKFPRRLATAGALLLLAGPAVAQGDPANGEKVFKRCAACHAVGEGAKNKLGPHLNELFGRTAGGLEDYKYSKPMTEAGEGGLVWEPETLRQFLADPRGMVKGTKMAFAGLKKDDELADIVAYLAGFSSEDAAAADETAPAAEPAEAASTETAAASGATAEAAEGDRGGWHTRDGGVFGLGRAATSAEVAAWDIDIRPDGAGLPEGRGTVADGDTLFQEQCASCHGVFGEGAGRWPVLAGGHDTLTDDRPEKTVGSYWPFLSTVYDYIRRAMPFGNAHSLTDDEVYALTAYVLYLNDIVTDEEFELSHENFAEIELPNEGNFVEDDRPSEAHYAKPAEPCMTDCKPGPVKVEMRARILDVTPGSVEDDEGAGAGAVD